MRNINDIRARMYAAEDRLVKCNEEARIAKEKFDKLCEEYRKAEAAKSD